MPERVNGNPPAEAPSLPPSVPLVQWWTAALAWQTLTPDDARWTDDLREWVKVWAKLPPGIEHKHKEILPGPNQGILYRCVYSVPPSPVKGEGPVPPGGLDDSPAPVEGEYARAAERGWLVEIWEPKAANGPGWFPFTGMTPAAVVAILNDKAFISHGYQKTTNDSGRQYRVTIPANAPKVEEKPGYPGHKPGRGFSPDVEGIDAILARKADEAKRAADVPTMLDRYALAVAPALVPILNAESATTGASEADVSEAVARHAFNLAIALVLERDKAIERLALLRKG